MACFVVPAAEAVITTLVKHVVESKEEKHLKELGIESKEIKGFSRQLSWLNNMLWGGSCLLAVEHIWHGEVVPYYPFLTALNSGEETTAMLYEMATVGVTMAAAITFVWIVMVVTIREMERRHKQVDIG